MLARERLAALLLIPSAAAALPFLVALAGLHFGLTPPVRIDRPWDGMALAAALAALYALWRRASGLEVAATGAAAGVVALVAWLAVWLALIASWILYGSP